jgi:hypothetical protein
MSATTAVRVTEKHITDGRPSDACNCPFALAVTEALAAEGATVTSIWVGEPDFEGDSDARWGVEVKLYDDGVSRTRTAELSQRAIDWIVAFDTDKAVDPIEVELTWEPTQ